MVDLLMTLLFASLSFVTCQKMITMLNY
uniref:Uncharacterized protein n=1 Tax=Rhizophora mucronata TaxID=61149 RepID=A0A2P2NH37_RHIMU